MKIRNITELLKIVELEKFEKNFEIDYLVRCVEVGDGEEEQIIGEDYQLENQLIPFALQEKINKQLLNPNLSLKALDKIKDELIPYISYRELFEENFDLWEACVLYNDDLEALKDNIDFDSD